MPWLAPVAALAGPILGGAVGAVTSQGERNAGTAAEQAAVQQWLSVNVPDPQTQKVEFQKYLSTGQLSPQYESAMKQGPSAFSQITVDPALKGAQMNALSSLQNEGSQGGLTLADQATNQQAINDANAAARGRAASIMSQYAQQGLGGSGLELQAELQNAQNANQTQAASSLNAAAQARLRALQAVQGAGSLGGQIEQQQYSQAANAAQAQDAINRFNTQNAQNIANTNTNFSNAAQQYNLQNNQNIANRNTGLSNQQQMYNKNLIQQNFQNQATKASGAANALTGQANYLGNQANSQAGMWAGVGSGVGKAGVGLGTYFGSPNNGVGSGSATGLNASNAGFEDEENKNGNG